METAPTALTAPTGAEVDVGGARGCLESPPWPQGNSGPAGWPKTNESVSGPPCFHAGDVSDVVNPDPPFGRGLI